MHSVLYRHPSFPLPEGVETESQFRFFNVIQKLIGDELYALQRDQEAQSHYTDALAIYDGLGAQARLGKAGVLVEEGGHYISNYILLRPVKSVTLSLTSGGRTSMPWCLASSSTQRGL